MSARVLRRAGRAVGLNEDVVRRVNQLIAEQDLKEGDRLPSERVLAGLLGVSRPTVREAVKTLEGLGRLTVRHGLGVFVRAPVDRRSGLGDLTAERVRLRDLFQMRLVLEVPAAGWAATSGSEAQIETLVRILGDLELASRKRPLDYEYLKQLDSSFHIHIAHTAGNPFLAQTMEVLQKMLAASMETTLKIPGRLEKSRKGHRRILAAIQRRDPRSAERAMRGHLEQVQAAAYERVSDQW